MAAMSRTTEQFAVQYANHRKGGKLVTLGNYDADFDTVDLVRDLRRQGYEPVVLRREVTVTYSDWVAGCVAIPDQNSQEERQQK